jgi:small subunit ribosomal protein S7
MSRRREPPKRVILPDPQFHNTTLTKFISRLMLHGKRSTAMRITYDALDDVAKKADVNGIEAFLKAIENVKPRVEVKSRRVGGSTYQVPVEIRESRREALAMRWIIQAARGRGGRAMSRRLSAELLDAYNQTGTAFKKKEDTHRMADANKAFAHYRW